MHKKVFENDFMLGMQRELVKQASGGVPDLSKAAECLHAALEILEEQGLISHANQLTNVLLKIAQSDSATKGLTEKKQVENLKEYGTTLNVNNADDLYVVDVYSAEDELMALDIKEDSLEVFDADTGIEDFEDERDTH